MRSDHFMVLNTTHQLVADKRISKESKKQFVVQCVTKSTVFPRAIYLVSLTALYFLVLRYLWCHTI